MSAATIETTLSTDPADVINPDYETIPLGQDTAETIRQEMESAESDDEPATDTRAAPDQARESGSGGDSRLSEGFTASDRSLLDRLLDNLLYVLIAVAAVTITLIVLYRRNRLLELLTYAILPPESARSETTDGDQWPRGPPSDPVEQTWAALVHSLNPEHPELMTPRECAAAAIEAGFDERAVARLTETFEEVAYGGSSVTTDHEQIANESRKRLDLGGRGDE